MPEHSARIRQAFLDAGAKLGDPALWDDTIVDLNPIDMSYHGYVPSDIAQRIDDGRIPHANIPTDFHHDKADKEYAKSRPVMETHFGHLLR